MNGNPDNTDLVHIPLPKTPIKAIVKISDLDEIDTHDLAGYSVCSQRIGSGNSDSYMNRIAMNRTIPLHPFKTIDNGKVGPYPFGKLGDITVSPLHSLMNITLIWEKHGTHGHVFY